MSAESQSKEFFERRLGPIFQGQQCDNRQRYNTDLATRLGYLCGVSLDGARMLAQIITTLEDRISALEAKAEGNSPA
jgi:hypothetical protein